MMVSGSENTSIADFLLFLHLDSLDDLFLYLLIPILLCFRDHFLIDLLKFRDNHFLCINLIFERSCLILVHFLYKYFFIFNIFRNLLNIEGFWLTYSLHCFFFHPVLLCKMYLINQSANPYSHLVVFKRHFPL